MNDQALNDHTLPPPVPVHEIELAQLPPVPMIDTIRPQNIPAGWTNPVLAYRDGVISQWPLDQIMRFDKVAGITVTGAPSMARIAREVDRETFDATAEAVPAFLDARAELGHHDGTVYCSRDSLPQVFADLNARRPRLHVATLDNFAWTPAELAANIQGNPMSRVPVSLEELTAMIWAIQCYRSEPGRPWDLSLVYGARDFWDPQAAPAAEVLTGPASPYLYNEGLADRPVSTLGDLAVFLRGSSDSFTGELLRLMAKADLLNFGRLARVFPVQARAFDVWMTTVGLNDRQPTWRELLDGITERHSAAVTG